MSEVLLAALRAHQGGEAGCGGSGRRTIINLIGDLDFISFIAGHT
jgi:hypothetical protein